jgi:hypothetical protein
MSRCNNGTSAVHVMVDGRTSYALDPEDNEMNDAAQVTHGGSEGKMKVKCKSKRNGSHGLCVCIIIFCVTHRNCVTVCMDPSVW